jgi:hypothetical protein
MTLPGGQIISGVGGCIFQGPYGGSTSTSQVFRIDVGQWALDHKYNQADCTHSGTYGAISRRRVSYDWTFKATMPMDLSNLAELLLWLDQSVSIRLNLGDATYQNGQQPGENYVQKYYFAPSVYLRNVRTILDAAGKDVIRCEAEGEGNSLLFVMPDQATQWSNYQTAMGWPTS